MTYSEVFDAFRAMSNIDTWAMESDIEAGLKDLTADIWDDRVAVMWARSHRARQAAYELQAVVIRANRKRAAA